MNDQSPALLGLALFAVVAVPFAGTASADGGQGPYFGLRAAGAIVEDSEADGVDIEFDTGFSISGQVGYQFDIFRLEGEFGFQGFEGLSETDVNSDVNVGRFTLNGFVDFPIAPNFGPYVGGGFGVASLSARDDFEDEDTAFTWHAEAGLNIGVNRQFVISPFYRYQEIDTDLGQQTEPLAAHLFGVSLRYHLTWLGKSRGKGGHYHVDDGAYRGGGGGGYSGGYRSYDRYDRRDRYYDDDRPRRKKKKKPVLEEKDDCGWKGPGCEEEGFEGWGG